MRDLVAAVGLMLAIEGLCLAAFPGATRRMAAQLANAPADLMRVVGVVSATLGVGLVWLMRDHVS